MNSQIFTGKIVHTRFLPHRYSFTYPSVFFGFDLDEIDSLQSVTRLFRHNAFGVLSLWDTDFLAPGAEPLREKVARVFSDRGIELQGWSRTVVLTNPRYLGYIFNPVSFFLCLSREGTLLASIANVNNTFSESHIYVLHDLQRQARPEGEVVTCTRCKDFHVSPFFDVRGRYAFAVRHSPTTIDIDIAMEQDATREFQAHLTGEGIPFGHEGLVRVLRRYPFNAVLAFPRIVYQAKRLWWNEKLPWHTRPAPQSAETIRKAPPGSLERIGKRVATTLLRSIRTGFLEVTFPDGTRHIGGDANSSLRCAAQIHDYRFFKNLLFQGEIGFCESYVNKDFTCSDMLSMFQIVIANSGVMDSRWLNSTRLLRPFAGALHLLRRNTRSQSERNIHVHYDIGNKFYQTFLDDQMVYSCGYYESQETTLEQAQVAKIDRLLDRADLSSSHHLLEIGCGWGALAVAAAKRFGCRVTGVTLSREQYEFARARVEREGLAHLVTIRYMDYRDITGSFDRIVSCEMIEAVGCEYLQVFFGHCDRLLAPGGRLVLQAITMNERRYPAYCRAVDWIQYSIFPGGHLPSVGALLNAARRSSQLQFDEAWEFGRHYARTLRDWRQRLLSSPERREAAERPMTLERRWVLYLQYCEAAFLSRHIGTHHLVFTKLGGESQPPVAP